MTIGWILASLLLCTLWNFMRFHWKLICENYTTIENIDREETQISKYDVGWRRNLEQVDISLFFFVDTIFVCSWTLSRIITKSVLDLNSFTSPNKSGLRCTHGLLVGTVPHEYEQARWRRCAMASALYEGIALTSI